MEVDNYAGHFSVWTNGGRIELFRHQQPVLFSGPRNFFPVPETTGYQAVANRRLFKSQRRPWVTTTNSIFSTKAPRSRSYAD